MDEIELINALIGKIRANHELCTIRNDWTLYDVWADNALDKNVPIWQSEKYKGE